MDADDVASAPKPEEGATASWSGRALAMSLALGVALLLTAAGRVWVIRHFPEPDTDAAGHLGMASALLSDPTNIAIHWVYLPAYHFVLAALLAVGLTADSIRLVNCALAALVPLVVLGYGHGAAAGPRDASSRRAAWMAAGFCAISPLVNLLGTSAQQETLFTLLVVGAVWAVDARRFALGGGLLAFAALVRYEAWGAVGLLVGLRVAGQIPSLVRRAPPRLAGAFRLPLAVTVPSVLAIGAFLFAHERREGQWLGVLRDLYRYTHAQSDVLQRPLAWFPLEQPLFVFGSIGALLFVAGARRAWRPSHTIPLGIYLFLLVAYSFGGALDSARYYESLTPFVALAAAHGVEVVSQRWRWLAPALFAVASVQLVGRSTELFLWTWPAGDAAHEAPVPRDDADGHDDRAAGIRPPPTDRATR